ncbi:MAG: hypothetical protein ACRC8R_12115 [Aeromonas hydrophila]
MQIENISNDNEQYAYTEGHVDGAEFLRAVQGEGFTPMGPPMQQWMAEKPIPSNYRDSFSQWFEFCVKEEPGSLPVTWCRVV